MNVCNIDDGDYIEVCSVDFGFTGAGVFKGSVSSAFHGGSIELHLDSVEGPLIGVLPISCTGDWDNWKLTSTNISSATGVHNLYLLFKGDVTGNLFKFDYWKFEQKSSDHELVAINTSLDRYIIDSSTGDNIASMKIMAIYADGCCEDITYKAEITTKHSELLKIGNGIVTGIDYGIANISVSYEEITDEIYVIIKNRKEE